MDSRITPPKRVTSPHLHVNKQALSLGKENFCVIFTYSIKQARAWNKEVSFGSCATTTKWNGGMNLRVRPRVKSFKVLRRIRHLFDDFKSSIVISARENFDIDITVHTFLWKIKVRINCFKGKQGGWKGRVATWFPGFSPTSPYGSKGRRENLGTRLEDFKQISRQQCDGL